MTEYTLIDNEQSFHLGREARDILMAHGMLRTTVPGQYELSSTDNLRADPGSAGVNHPEPLAVLAIVRAALSARPAMPIAIRDLVWVGPDLSGDYYTKDALVPYKLRAWNDNGFWLTEVGGYFPTEQAAFAAAADHYRQHVRKALVNTDQSPAGYFLATAFPDGEFSFQPVPAGQALRPDVLPLYAPSGRLDEIRARSTSFTA